MIVEPTRDAVTMAALHAAAFVEPWNVEALAALIASSGVFALMAREPGGAPAGFILARVAADEAEILTLATAPAYRRAGVASALIETAAELALGAGAGTLLLEVAEDNAPARALYAARGFGARGRRPRYYARAGSPVDALMLARPLVAGDLNSGAAAPYADAGE